MTVIEEIADERRRQIEAEGWTPAHDDEHAQGELARAAACYALAGNDTAGREKASASRAPECWPFETKWWKPRGQRRNLIRAAALIVAEIERIDRQALQKSTRAAIAGPKESDAVAVREGGKG